MTSASEDTTDEWTEGAAEQLHLLRGQGGYIDDVETTGATLQLAFVRSPYPRARIEKIDINAALALPGVQHIFTGADIAHRVRPISARLDADGDYEYRPADWPALADGEVRYVGEAVAVVVADSRYHAEDGAELVAVEYEQLPAVADAGQALAVDAPKVHDSLPDNVLFRVHTGASHDDSAFDDDDLVCVRGQFRHPRVTGLAIENRGVLAEYRSSTGELVVWSSTQIPHLLRDALAECLGLPASSLRVIAPDVGGAFGIKMQAFPEELVAAFLARTLQRPIKWIEDRMENLQASVHARDVVVDAEMAAHKDGRLAWLRARALYDVGAYSTFPLTAALEPHTAAPVMPGPYHLPVIAYDGLALATNKCPEGAYRGVGVPVGPLTVEGLVDRLASRLAMDPVEVRRKNLVAPNEFPFHNAAGAVYDSGNYPGLLELALEQAGYDSWREQQKQARAEGRLLGIGVSCFVEPTGMNRTTYRSRGMVQVPGFDGAVLRVDPVGRIEAAVSTPSQGQSQATAFTRLLCETLGVSAQTIHISLGDTARTPYGCGTFASRGVVSGGGALLQAADKLKNKLCRLAAQHWGVEPRQVRYRDAAVARSDDATQRLNLSELAAIAHGPMQVLPADCEPGLEVHCFYDPPVTAVSAGVHLVLAEVDQATGGVRLLRYVVGEDCGRMINPQAVAGQIRGGVAQGIGTALLEDLIYDADGQLLTATLMDYLVPGSCDVPNVEIVHQATPSPFTEGGLKGVGESGVIGAPPAVVGAVIDAIGCQPEVVCMPLTPERVLNLINEREQP